MTKFSVDYNNLDQHLNGKKTYKLEDVKGRIAKVAFDIVRFVDGDHTIDNLWRIENTSSGDIIVAMYDDGASEKMEVTASKKDGDWSVTPDKTSSYVTIFYKKDPIKKVAFSELSVEKDDASIFCQHLSNKLSENKTLVTSLLKSVGSEEKEQLLSKYPELKGI